MIRNLKVLGLMVVAALALAAMLAPGAGASKTEAGTLTSGATPEEHTASELHGTQYGTPAENVFTAFEETVSCTSGTYTGTATGTDTTVELASTYSGCTAGNGLPATVTPGDCKFTFAQPATFNDPEGRYTGLGGLKCTSSAGVLVHIYSGAAHGFTVCTLTVTPVPHELSHVIYKNVPGSPDHLTVAATVGGITAHESGLCGSGTDTAASLNTKVTLNAYKPNTNTEVAHDLWISDATTP